MRASITKVALTGLLCLSAAASWAALTEYGQDFETLIWGSPDALSSDGWIVWGNVFDSDALETFLYSYGPFPAPVSSGGGSSAFSDLDLNLGGPAQGVQHLSVFSDYENGGAHSLGQVVESNVYQERIIVEDDVGRTVRFEFEAKAGNISDVPNSSTAAAFIKTVDPATGYPITNYLPVDMTNISSSSWERFSISIFIDSGLEGQLLQFGFLNRATIFQGSAVFYDNLSLSFASPGAVPSMGPVGLLLLGACLMGTACLQHLIRRRSGRILPRGDIGHS